MGVMPIGRVAPRWGLGRGEMPQMTQAHHLGGRAMPNTLTGLIPAIYEALDVVSRELTGMLPSVRIAASSETAALGQSIRVPIEQPGTGVDVVPAMTVPEPAGQVSTYRDIVITKSRAYPFGFDGEEVKGLQAGAGYEDIRALKIAQAIRGLINEIEADLCALHIHASRAVGVAGTTPFATSLRDAAEVRKVLDDNGAPQDRSLVIDTAAGVNLRSLANLTDANRAGTTDVRALGRLVSLFGFDVRESAQVQTHTPGTAAGWTVAAATAAGATQITLAGGTGAFVPGDVITIAGDANQYVVHAWDAATNTLTIGEPGLRVAAAAAAAVTVVGASARNLAFSRNAIVLAARPPAVPEGGDAADDRTVITDPVTGMSLEFAVYRGYRRERYEVALAWGAAVVKPEHCAILLG